VLDKKGYHQDSYRVVENSLVQGSDHISLRIFIITYVSPLVFCALTLPPFSINSSKASVQFGDLNF
jgi:hypothetical protein